jgi:hypothetical protein
MKKNRKEGAKVFKSFRKRLNILSYQMIYYNRISSQLLIFLFVFDVIFMGVLPMQILANLNSNNASQ